MDDIMRIALDAVTVGPRGGRLDNPKQNPERRKANLAVAETVDGQRTLHRFQRDYEDASVPGLKNEQPWHRMAAYMLLSGRTNSEIAMSANVGAQEVSNLRTQRWFQELLAILANETGEDLRGAIISHAQDAINRIADIAGGDIETYGARTVLSANLSLLEHATGKPVQKIVSNISHSVSRSPQDEMDEIQQELAALRSKEEQPR